MWWCVYYILGRLRTPVPEAFSYGITAYFIVIQWSIRSYSIETQWNIPYPVWKCLTNGSPQPPYFWLSFFNLILFYLILLCWCCCCSWKNIEKKKKKTLDRVFFSNKQYQPTMLMAHLAALIMTDKKLYMFVLNRMSTWQIKGAQSYFSKFKYFVSVEESSL